MKISTAENDRDIVAKSFNYARFYKWEDDKWETVNLSAGFASNDSEKAQPYIIVPADKGKFQVYLECNGFQAVKSIGGKADGCWSGLVAYEATGPGWLVNQYVGCTITNYQSSMKFVCGHPDVELNGCKFKANRGVEADFYASFDLEADDDDSKWVLYAPDLRKDSDYNYVVSYGGYTDKICEIGSIAISIDEVNAEGSGNNSHAAMWRLRESTDKEKSLKLPLKRRSCWSPDSEQE